MEINYDAVFGVQEGVNGQEVAEPAEEEESTAEAESQEGANEQEVAEPAGEEQDLVEEEEEAREDPEEDHTQSKEERAGFAAARRRAEAEKEREIERVRQEAKAEAERAINAIFADAAMIDPYTGRTIQNKEEFESYQKRLKEDQIAEALQRSGMDEQTMDTLIGNHPAVRAAAEAAEKLERAEQQAEDARMRIKFAHELQEVSKIDPRIQTEEDLMEHPSYARVYELVGRGNNLVDAFRLANLDTLTERAVAAARQSARNADAGKSHLTKTDARGDGAVSVPEDVRANYRMLLPHATDAEIQRHYNKYKSAQ